MKAGLVVRIVSLLDELRSEWGGGVLHHAGVCYKSGPAPAAACELCTVIALRAEIAAEEGLPAYVPPRGY